MWIIRFHLLQTKDYNKISRICKKYGFSPRRVPPIIFAKATLLHMTQKISWRALGREFGVDHILLYRFHESASKKQMLQEIFHVFLLSRIALYIADTKTITTETLDNSQEIFLLTQEQFRNILKEL